MFQLILLAAIVYILFRWLRGGAHVHERPAPGGTPGGPIEEMVQDPACGTWVPLSQALAARSGNETFHFCSPECRDKFLGKPANG